ncbi:MAG: tRNA (adenosine(37)-N6)-threonylcarbamoyltransferase complex dimerization subunit type 1 TsaB [Clostridia bacterium]|nr:tRNA (adenosine(37)-N6)-threonylcarbamoyltransferase complex dimerization subunit type 1 TsaB [Clostridia bacterium]
MNLLLLDSTKTQLIVALAVDGKITVTKTCDEQRQHDKNINLLINELGVDKFDAVAVVTGPGSWTGIRVGLAVAKAFAYAQSIPLIELRDEINVDEAMRKFQAGATVSPFAIQPFYNGEFIVKTKATKE